MITGQFRAEISVMNTEKPKKWRYNHYALQCSAVTSRLFIHPVRSCFLIIVGIMRLIHSAITVHHLTDDWLNMWRVDWMKVSELKTQEIAEIVQPCGNCTLSDTLIYANKLINVTSPLYTVVHSGYIVICSTFLYTCWFLHETAHCYHPCYAMDDICEYLSWYQGRIIWDIKLNNYHNGLKEIH